MVRVVFDGAARGPRFEDDGDAAVIIPGKDG
jgi:hypothetical protein